MARILDQIDSPANVKRLSIPELEQLVAEIREELIAVLARTGGRLGPTLAWWNPPLQCITSSTRQKTICFLMSAIKLRCISYSPARQQFATIRSPGGLSGFMLRMESLHDCYGAGHAGTPLSAAWGMAVARDKVGGKNMTLAGRRRRFHLWAGKFGEKLGGKRALRMTRKAKEAAKSMLWPSVIFGPDVDEHPMDFSTARRNIAGAGASNACRGGAAIRAEPLETVRGTRLRRTSCGSAVSIDRRTPSVRRKGRRRHSASPSHL